ncbi:MAG TPA: ABC transporter substrate-binding protein [Candidatus Lustribacter sp.]|nr:ABC transporter substrate-binding protein [Candidatus Lustribacter sp.]
MRRLLAAVTAGGLLLLAPPSGAQNLQKITITYASHDANQSAPLVAQQKGYFAAEGLEAELQYAGGGVATPALMSGNIQASGSAAASLTAILKGAPLRIVGITADASTYSLWVSNDIKTAADLKGKTIGVASRGDTLEVAARIYLAAVGIPPDSVGYQPLGQPSGIGAGLETGALSAAIIATTDSSMMLDRGQLKKAHVLADLSKYKMPYAGIAMAEKTLYGDPVLAKKMMRAIIKGFRYMKAFKPETIAILQKAYQTDDAHAVETGYDYASRAFTRDYTVSDAVIVPDLTVRAGLLGISKDQLPPLIKIYDFTLAHQINAELDAAHWKPTR